MSIIKKTSIGIDISDKTIEIIRLVKKGGKIDTLNKGRLIIESGIIDNGEIKDREKLKKAVEEILKISGINSFRGNDVNFAMPESQVFIKVINIDIDKNLDEQEQVEAEVYKNIPIQKDEMVFNFKEIVLESNKKITKKSFLIIATKKSQIRQWQEFFQLFNIKIDNFDVETLANHRNLFNSSHKDSFCILDIGKRTTNISIFKNEEIIHIYSLNIAGNYFSNLIKEKLNINFEEAEKRKKTEGMNNKDIKEVLSQALDEIIKELRITLDYYKEIINLEVGEIVLIGGSSKVIGLEDYFKNKFQRSVHVGKSEYLKDQLGLEYIEVVGLALKGLEREYQKNDLSISLPIEKKSFVQNVLQKSKREEQEAVVGGVIDSEELDSGGDSKKVKKQFLALIIIITVGVLLVGSSYVYRKNEKERKAAEIEESVNKFLLTQDIDLSVILAISIDEYIQGRVKARLIEGEISDEEDSVEIAKEKVQGELKTGEFLWEEPIEKSDEEKIVKWLVYNKDSADKLFLDELDKINNKNIEYNLVKIEQNNIRKSENENLLLLDGVVTVSLDELIAF